MMCLWASYKKKIGEKTNIFCILKINDKRSRIRSWIQIRIHLSELRIGDPDPQQNVTDPQHRFLDFSRSKYLKVG
jgi:hypothetical protein